MYINSHFNPPFFKGGNALHLCGIARADPLFAVTLTNNFPFAFDFAILKMEQAF
jgi:hypothetical protein